MSRVLVVTGGPDHAHDFDGDETGTGPALAAIARDAGHDVTLTDDVDAAFADAPVERWDAIVVNALRWRMEQPRYEPWRDRWALRLSDSARGGIDRYVAAGGGLVGNHTASICFDDWPGWRDVLGGAWSWDRSSHPPPAPVTVRVVERHHPVTAGLPAAFDLVDEVYGDLDLRDDLDVLAVARRTPGDAEQPVVWARTHGEGRVVYDALGHDAASLRDPVHARLLVRSIAWVAAREREGVTR